MSIVDRLISDLQTDVPEIEDAIALQQMRLELLREYAVEIGEGN